METALESFVTRFAAGAGTEYVWCLEDGCLRAKLPTLQERPYVWCLEDDAPEPMCPVSAQATLEYGRVLYAGDYDAAARRLGLDFRTILDVLSIADNFHDRADVELAQLRARLLRICRVGEEG